LAQATGAVMTDTAGGTDAKAVGLPGAEGAGTGAVATGAAGRMGSAKAWIGLTAVLGAGELLWAPPLLTDTSGDLLAGGATLWLPTARCCMTAPPLDTMPPRPTPRGRLVRLLGGGHISLL
jgi:hypothetical protein